MTEHPEYPTFRAWLGGADELTDAELERYRQTSLTGECYNLAKAWDELMRVTLYRFFEVVQERGDAVWRWLRGRD